MARIKLIVTGNLEERGLADALGRAFPDHEFFASAKHDCFTSDRLGAYPSRGEARERVGSPVGRIASELVASASARRKGEDPADFVVAVEDLERANLGQPGHVVDYFRRAVEDVVTARGWSLQHELRVRSSLRARCSFHLFVPMIEAYFFAHPEALEHLQATADSRFDPATTDMEQFAVASHPGLPVGDERLVHPKKYANFLCDPSGARDRAYRETKQGLRVLEHLDWGVVLSEPKHGKFLRALFHDLAWGLEVDAPFPGEVAEETRVRDDGLLRNL